MDFIKGFNRDQLMIMDFESNIAFDSWARAVDCFVDMLPMEQLGFQDVLNDQGRPPYHSSDMLKLLMYGYKKKLRSSRQLEEACNINIEVIWLLQGLKPSARKIAYFRKTNPDAFKKSFRYFVKVLQEMDLIDGETIAIDSFKIRAQNSLKNNFNQSKIDRHLKYIDDKIDAYEKQLDLEDMEEEKHKEIAGKIDTQKQRKKEYQHIGKQLTETGESQISTTDADAKSVILHRNVVNVGYNIQAGCDSKHKLFVNNDTGSVNDTHALATMALDAKELLGLETMNTLTDKGYTTGVHIDTCTKNHITTYSSPKAHSSQNNGLYDMQIFEYTAENDTYTCPAGAILATNGTVYKKRNHRVKHYKNRTACKDCILRSKCTTNKNGRFIERSIYQEALEENEKRVKDNPEYYKLRQQITEHQFGTLKRQWDFSYTLMKGKEHVLSEVNLIMMVYNLRRLMSIFDMDELKTRLNQLVSLFMAIFKQNKGHLRPLILKNDARSPKYLINLRIIKQSFGALGA
jgi:transposase